MFCSNCGQQVADNTAFCPNCGQPTAQTNGQQQYQGQQAQQQGASNFVDNIFDTPDETASYTQEDINNGKVMSILSYIGILVLVPLIVEQKNPYVRFHVNQGFVLFVLNIAVSIVSFLFSFIPIAGVIISSLLSLVVLAFMVLGIVNAAQDKAKELPFIGNFRWIK